MSNHSPITPPTELVQQWENRIFDEQENVDVLLIEAYKAGADQELEACCEWLFMNGYDVTSARLCTARRPKPPSLKEQALLQLDTLNADLAMHGRGCDLSQIRRALEALND